MITLRKLQKGDLPACAQIIDLNELFQQYHFTGEAATRVLTSALEHQDTSDLRVAVESNEIMGFAWVVRKGAFDRASYLRLIALHPKATGKKIGSTLLKALEETHLRPYGFFLLATATNTAARRFYEKHGYQHVGTIPNFVRNGVNECIYFKGSPA